MTTQHEHAGPDAVRTPRERLDLALAEFARHAAVVLAVEGAGMQILFDCLADCNRDVYDFASRNSHLLAGEAPEYRAALAQLPQALEAALGASRQCRVSQGAETSDAAPAVRMSTTESGDADSAEARDRIVPGESSGIVEEEQGPDSQAAARAETFELEAEETSGPGAESGSGSAPQPGVTVVVEPDHTAELRSLRERLRERLALLPAIIKPTIPEPPPHQDSAQFHWRRLHLDLLRLAEAERRQFYREHANGPAFAHVEEWNPDVELIPPMSPSAGPRVPDARTAASGSELDALISRAHQAIELFETDEELILARTGATQFDSFEQSSYGERIERALSFLTDRVRPRSLGAPAPEAIDLATTASQLDELIGGLVHRQPAARESWWWTWREAWLRELEQVLEPFGCRMLGSAELKRTQRIGKDTDKDISARTYKNELVWVVRAAILASGKDEKLLVPGRIIVGAGRDA